MVLDHKNKTAFAAISQRTDIDVFHLFCQEFGYSPVAFHAYQTVDAKGSSPQRKLIYHTNVMMSIADDFAIVCADAIDDADERMTVVEALKQGGREVVFISEEQTSQFAGNMLTLKTVQPPHPHYLPTPNDCEQTVMVHSAEDTNVKQNEGLLLVMSATAFQCLNEKQKDTLSKYAQLITCNLKVIETLGGGSARCMIAEIFLPTV
eukprot:m.127715 g.127715  ORF g.127715 m.127715 type:complete len:206 (+) comp9444_c1_seq7:862-1479(+)